MAKKQMYEVEMKFPVDGHDALERRLAEFGVVFEPEIEEIDCYYQHPSRDFGRTDEALRIRRVLETGKPERTFLTYKGPKIDKETKTRREIEIPLDDATSWDAVLTALGFSPRGRVRKFRRKGDLLLESRKFGILLDWLPDLEGSPSGSRFVELETLAEDDDLDAARRTLIGLAARLGLSGSIRKGYLSLSKYKRLPGDDPVRH